MICHWRKTIVSYMCVFLLVVGIMPKALAGSLLEKFDRDPSEIVTFINQNKNTYADTKKQYQKNGLISSDEEYIALPSLNAKSILLPYSDEAGKTPNVFTLNNNQETLEWTFDVLKSGLYQVQVEYYLDAENDASSCSVAVNNKVPFSECEEIIFYGSFKDDEKNPTYNRLNDQIRPKQLPIHKKQLALLADKQAMYEQPFQFFIESGKSTVSFQLLTGEMYLVSVKLVPCSTLKDYSTVKQEYIDKNYHEPENAGIISFQAETEVIEKNNPALRRESNGDPKCTPVSIKNTRYNVMGDWTWRSANQSLTWEFQVNKAGLYNISMRVMQSYTNGLPIYRQITIDDAVPFKELLAYGFGYDREWQLETLHDDKSEPYLFYFTPGKHTIKMTVKMGDSAVLMQSLYEDMQLLSDLLLNIKMITTSTPDPNYDYQLERQIPELFSTLQKLNENAKHNIKLNGQPNGKIPAISNALKQNIDIVQKLIEHPDRIASNLSDLENTQETLSTWYTSLRDMALAIDCFYIVPQGQKAVLVRASFFDKISGMMQGLINSYFRDYNSIGGLTKGMQQLDVWIGRGKEWAEVLKRLTDDEFTSKTGIEINLNVLPASQLNSGGNNILMLSVASGTAPDLAMGVGSSLPVEFAIRDAAVDLSELDGFNETFQDFLPNIQIPFQYNGGVFGIPETMDFRVMFYRKDILAQLKATIPQTWDDVYNDLLPLLYQNNMEMYVGADFPIFLFQNGGTYYTSDRTKSALDTPEAFRAFKQMTELYTNYGIPVIANFYNRFRSGIMPVGIGGFADYLTIMVAAPEIGGKWRIAPIPGTRQKDGTINRSYSGMAVDATMILKQSSKQEQSWQFLKWWASGDTQTKYARDLEAMIGLSARWNTANIKAYKKISWDREDDQIIQAQWKWANEIPNVPGGYFTGRYVTNAWNSVIISKQRIRDSLEDAVFAINKELTNKQKQYQKSK